MPPHNAAVLLLVLLPASAAELTCTRTSEGQYFTNAVYATGITTGPTGPERAVQCSVWASDVPACACAPGAPATKVTVRADGSCRCPTDACSTPALSDNADMDVYTCTLSAPSEPPTPSDSEGTAHFYRNCGINNGWDNHGYNNGCPAVGDDGDVDDGMCDHYDVCSCFSRDEGCDEGSWRCPGPVPECNVPDHCEAGHEGDYNLQCNCPPNAHHDLDAHVDDIGCMCDWPDAAGSYRPAWYNDWVEGGNGPCPVPGICELPDYKIRSLNSCAAKKSFTGISAAECSAKLPYTWGDGTTASFASWKTAPYASATKCKLCAMEGSDVPDYKSSGPWTSFRHVGSSGTCNDAFGALAAPRSRGAGADDDDGGPLLMAALPTALAVVAAAAGCLLLAARARRHRAAEQDCSLAASQPLQSETVDV